MTSGVGGLEEVVPLHELEQTAAIQTGAAGSLMKSALLNTGCGFLLTLFSLGLNVPPAFKFVLAASAVGVSGLAVSQKGRHDAQSFKAEIAVTRYAAAAHGSINRMEEAANELHKAKLDAQLSPQAMGAPPMTEEQLILLKIQEILSEHGNVKVYLGEIEYTETGWRSPMKPGKGVKISQIESAVKGCSNELKVFAAIPECRVVQGTGALWLDVTTKEREALPAAVPLDPPVRSTAMKTVVEVDDDEEWADGDVVVPTPIVRPVTPAVKTQTPDYAQMIMKTLTDFGVFAKHGGVITGPTIERHQIIPSAGVSTKKIRALAPDLKVRLHTELEPLITEQPGFVAIDIPVFERKFLNFKDWIKREQRPNDSPVMIAFGVGLEGTLVEGNISEPEFCHALGGGMTGSGKTEMIIATTKSLTERYSPDLVKYVIHTMKVQDFREPFFQSNPWMWRKTSRSPMEALDLLRDLVIEMRGRNQILADAKCKNIDVYNRQHVDAPLHHLLFHFDEAGGTILGLGQIERDEMNDLDKKGKKRPNPGYVAEAQSLARTLAKEARASGIHLFVWDQKPSGESIDTNLRSELGLRICLKVRDVEASRMVIDCADGTQLFGKGDTLVDIGGAIQRIQGFEVPFEILDESWDSPKPDSPFEQFDDAFEEKFGVDPDDVLEVDVNSIPQGLKEVL